MSRSKDAYNVDGGGSQGGESGHPVRDYRSFERQGCFGGGGGGRFGSR